MRKQLLSVLLFTCPLLMQAQEVFINAGLVSSYMWRGMKCGNASVQPTLGVNMGGFTSLLGALPSSATTTTS